MVVQCRFCGAKWQTHYGVVADHCIENGCPWCQLRLSNTAERLLRQVSGLHLPPRRGKTAP